MTEPGPDARPSQVTVAGWVVAAASAFLVIGAFDDMAGLGSVDTRERVAKALTTGSFRGLGISVDSALEVMRWAFLVSGAAAAASVILGVYVLRRHRGARIGLTVAAVPIVLAAPFSDNVLSMVVAAATAILWTRPARDWFAGRAPTPAPARPVPPVPAPPPQQAPYQQAPYPQPPYPQPPYLQPPYPTGPYPPPPGWVGAPVPRRRPQPPSQVRLACILTWVLGGLTALAYLVVLVVLAASRDRLLELLHDSPRWDSGYDDDTIVALAGVMSVVVVVWCVVAAVLAVLTWRGVRGAWIALVVSAVLAALVAAVAFPFSIVHLAVTASSAGMLTSRPTREWFVRR